MIDIMRAICLEQMKKLPANLEFRRHIQKRYNEELHLYSKDHHTLKCSILLSRLPQRIDSMAPDGSGFIGVPRDNIDQLLSDKKIHTSVHFKPLYLYEPLKQNRRYLCLVKSG